MSLNKPKNALINDMVHHEASDFSPAYAAEKTFLKNKRIMVITPTLKGKSWLQHQFCRPSAAV